mgnify:CR=1 FL=1
MTRDHVGFGLNSCMVEIFLVDNEIYSYSVTVIDNPTEQTEKIDFDIGDRCYNGKSPLRDIHPDSGVFQTS